MQVINRVDSSPNPHNELGNLAVNYSQKKWLYGVYVHGHGFDDHSGVAGWINNKNYCAWEYDTIELNYKIARVSFRTCFSDKAKKYCSSNAEVCNVFSGTYIPLFGWGFDI